MNTLTRLVAVLAVVGSCAAYAGSNCERREVDAHQLRSASTLTARVVEQLEARNRPLAVLSRVGQDLSGYGLRYSHSGLVVRDHALGRWTVIHQLNHCGGADSAIYAEGLLNFYLDDLYRYEAHIAWPDQVLSDGLLRALNAGAALRVFDPRYSVISRYGSARTQNSTAWLAELIGYALAVELPQCDRIRSSRPFGRCGLDGHGYRPEQIRISYGRRVVGGLFSANASFSDHPVSSRLSGKYQVVSVRSILALLRAREAVELEVVANPLS